VRIAARVTTKAPASTPASRKYAAFKGIPF
jgi:hypothetical protein